MSSTPQQTSAPLTLDGHAILFPPLPYDLHHRARMAVANDQLQTFVNSATYSKDAGRRKVFHDLFGDRYDSMRKLAGQIKQHTLDHLDYYLEQFVTQAQAAGTKVHFALDAKQANDIAVQIAREHGCKLCVKSKSMVTEETQLVPALESIGCQTVETDLAEFILQIDHDAPSHIVTAMIHKDRTAVGRAFERVLGVPYTDDPDALTQIARKHLRDLFRKADLGVSGGNFLVANTGSLVLCTNEGNGRMSTSAPRIHVAMVGIEKVVPDLDSLGVLLKMLARSSTAQPMTIYTHLMTGPRRADDHDGPEEMHVILIDNGRTDILHPATRDMLRCIRCGACLNACPVYRKIGGHSYGAVYSGPIGAILTPMLRGLHNYPDLPHASSLCGACFEACPVQIDIPRHLTRLRQELVARNLVSWSDRLMYRLWAMSLMHPLTYRLSGWFQKIAFRWQARLSGTLPAKGSSDPYGSRGWLRDLGGLFRGLQGWTQERDMPTPPAKSFRHWWDQHARSKADQPKGQGGDHE